MNVCRFATAVMLLLSLLVLSACEDDTRVVNRWEPGPSPASAAGDWSGTWVSFDGTQRAEMGFDLDQTGTELTGWVEFRNPLGELDLPGINSGYVLGNMIYITASGSEFIGTFEQENISGTFTYNFFGSGYTGTFEVTRED